MSRKTGKIDKKKLAMNGVNISKRGRKPSRRMVLMAVIWVLVLANLVIGLTAVGISNAQPEVVDVPVVEEEPEEPEQPEEPEENTDDLVAEPGEIDPATYQVAGYKPKFLSIPSLNLNTIPVVEIGTTPSNQLGSPKNIRLVGWYYRSAFPGKSGVAVMNAHGGNLGQGIFRALPQAKIGDEIVIEMGDGRKYTYEIREMNYKTLGDDANNYMSTALYSTLGEGVPTLTLITCTGKWLPNLQTYDSRLFVRAALK